MQEILKFSFEVQGIFQKCSTPENFLESLFNFHVFYKKKYYEVSSLFCSQKCSSNCNELFMYFVMPQHIFLKVYSNIMVNDALEWVDI